MGFTPLAAGCFGPFCCLVFLEEIFPVFLGVRGEESFLFKAINPHFSGKTGIKVHFGERGNETFLNPKYVHEIYNEAKKIEPDIALVESNVLYRGSRTNRKDHLATAKEHGFDFAPIVICDGEFGEDNWVIPVNLKHFKEVYIGKELKGFKNLIVISHFKGHGANGFGGTLKNIGMGLGSRAGKMAMHSAFKLIVDPDKCLGCGVCASKCGADAIEIKDGKAIIDFQKCVRCAGCIANCPQGAVTIPWGSQSSEDLQERIVEYCFGILQELKGIFYINVIENITAKCDCVGEKMKKIAPDIGIVGSTDPVAIDQASYDLLKDKVGEDVFKKIHNIDSTRQLSYAEKLGLGNTKYELIKL